MNKKRIGAAVLAGVLVAGCSNESTQSDQAAKDEVVLSVNGKTLTRAAISADVEAYLKASGDKIPAERLDYHKQMAQNQLVQSFILQSVLVEKAKADGYLVTDADRKAREDEFLKAIAQMPDAPKSVEEYFSKFPLGADRARLEFENGILIDKMLKDLRAKQPPTDYTAKAKEIVDNVTKDNAGAVTKINELKAELDKTPADQLAAKFAELAKANSACPSGQKGGDLGEFTRGQMVPEFDKVAFELPVGKVSDVVKTQFGYHLICVTKKIPAVEAQGENPAEPEKVQASHILIKANEVPKIEEVASFLQSQDERTFTQKFIMDTMKTAKIEAFADDFKQFVPPSEENSEVPVETSTEK